MATLAAVIVALTLAATRGLAASLRARRTRPKLTLDFDATTDLRREAAVLTQGGTSKLIAAVYARIHVANARGRRAAEGVEVLVSEIKPVSRSPFIEKASWSDDPIVNLGSLSWTHAEPPELTLGPGANRTVDLGWVPDMSLAIFNVTVTVTPLSATNQLPAGKYEITLTVAGHNVDASRWRVTLNYDGAWVSGDPPTEHLTISRPKRL